MSATFEIESTVTDRYQTTVPETVRRALKLKKRDKLHYTIRPSGEVLLSRGVDSENSDPALTPFLAFLANDIAQYPERLQTLDEGVVKRLRSLVGDMEIDLDAPLSADDE